MYRGISERVVPNMYDALRVNVETARALKDCVCVDESTRRISFNSTSPVAPLDTFTCLCRGTELKIGHHPFLSRDMIEDLPRFDGKDVSSKSWAGAVSPFHLKLV